MNKIIISCMMVVAVTFAMAAEKRLIKDIDTDEITSETQISPKGSRDDHIALIWWIPNEFWESILARDTTTSETDKKAMLDTMSGVSLLAVVQADVSPLGAFKFYSKEEIEKKMVVSYTDIGGSTQKLSTMQTITPDLEIVLSVFKPILGAAMGNLGSNLHFYVLNDTSESSPGLIDPYLEGIINVQLAKRNGDIMTGDIELPLNSLFIPRKCPNGKDAHISWKYCPWTGKKLED
jgi:hypothetical protein